MADADQSGASRLWESYHPYYAQEGNFFALGYHGTYPSWAEFVENEGNDDPDLNLVYRWDWKTPDPEDYAAEPDAMPQNDTLALFYIGQRKAIARSVEVAVTRDDEPAVREWLTDRAEHMRKVWEPLLDPSGNAPSGEVL